MHFKLDIDAKRWREAVKKFPARLAKYVRVALKEAMVEFVEKFKEEQLRGRPGLNRRGGDLIKSFVTDVSKAGTPLNKIEAWSFSRSKYATIQEKGGVITAKKGKYLAIPLPAALSPTGLVKGKYIAPGGLRNVPGLQFIKSTKRNQAILAELTSKGRFGGIIPLFVLKHSVRIPPRMGFFKVFRSWVSAGGFITHVRAAISASWNAARSKGKV